MWAGLASLRSHLEATIASAVDRFGKQIGITLGYSADRMEKAGMQKLLAKLEQISAPARSENGANYSKTITAVSPTKHTPSRNHGRPESKQTVQPNADQVDGITPAKRRILNALAFFESIGIDSVDKVQLALMADASAGGGSYQNNLGSLRTAALICYPSPGDVQLTTTGRAIADAQQSPDSTDELQRLIRAKLPPAKVRILDALIAAYPEPLEKEELATRAGASVGGGSFQNNLGSLRSMGLITYPQPGQAAAAPVLFLEGR